jgi:hypothetical protein
MILRLFGGLQDRTNVTSCQSCRSGSLDQKGMPWRTLPLYSS